MYPSTLFPGSGLRVSQMTMGHMLVAQRWNFKRQPVQIERVRGRTWERALCPNQVGGREQERKLQMEKKQFQE